MSDAGEARLKRLLKVSRRRYRDLHTTHQMVTADLRRMLAWRDRVIAANRDELLTIPGEIFEPSRHPLSTAAAMMGRKGGAVKKNKNASRNKDEHRATLARANTRKWELYRQRRAQVVAATVWGENT